MAKQFTILTTDLDLNDLQERLSASGDVDFLSSQAAQDLTGLQPLAHLAIPPSQAGEVSLICYLAQRGVPKSILIRRISEVKVAVDVERSHLISLWRPYYNGSIMRPGRLYYQNRLVENNIFVGRDPAFCKWADSVMSRVRRYFKLDKERRSYVGVDAAARIASAEIKVGSLLG